MNTREDGQFFQVATLQKTPVVRVVFQYFMQRGSPKMDIREFFQVSSTDDSYKATQKAFKLNLEEAIFIKHVLKSDFDFNEVGILEEKEFQSGLMRVEVSEFKKVKFISINSMFKNSAGEYSYSKNRISVSLKTREEFIQCLDDLMAEVLNLIDPDIRNN